MHPLLKRMAPLPAALLLSACISLDGVSIPSFESTGMPAHFVQYRCDNGYRVTVNYQNADAISISFNNGRDTFIDRARRAPAASGAYYVNGLNNLRWHEKNGTGLLTYPASDWRSSARLLETTCHAR